MSAQPRVIPMIAYADADRAASWIATAFGFRELERFTDERGVVTDVIMELDGAKVLIGHPNDAYEAPRAHAAHCDAMRKWLDTPWIVDGTLVYVDDVAAHLERARRVGARILTELESNPEQRQYRAEDCEGHRWMFATLLR